MKEVKNIGNTFVSRTVQEVIQGIGPGIFTVVFTKKDGTIRSMNARYGVSSGVKGTGRVKIDPNNITVFDVKLAQNGEIKEGNREAIPPERCYRSFRADSVSEIRAAGFKFRCHNGYVYSVTRANQ